MKRQLFIILMLLALFTVKAQIYDESSYFTIKVNGEVSTNNFYFYGGSDAVIKDKLGLINHSFGNVSELVITNFDFCYRDIEFVNYLIGSSFFYYITDVTNTTKYIDTTKVDFNHSLISSTEYDYLVYRDTKSANIDLLNGLPYGNYNLHFWFIAYRLSPNEPPGNSIWDDVNRKYYIANFAKTTVTTTGNTLNNKSSIFVKDNTIISHFNGKATIEIYKLNGEKICSENAINHFSKQVERGIYVLKINGQTFKVLV